MKRLLIYTPFSAWPNDTNIVAYLAGIFEHKGWQVHLLTCGGVLRACDVRQPSRCPQFAARDKQDMCAYCTDCRKYYNRLTTPIQHSLEQYLTLEAEFQEALLQSNDAEALQAISYRGYRLFDIAESSLYVHDRNTDLDFQDPATLALLRDYLFDAAVSINAIGNFLDSHDFDRVIIRNGRMNTTKAMLEIMRKQNKEFVTLDRGVRKGTLNLIHNEVVHGMYMAAAEQFEAICHRPLQAAEVNELAPCLLPQSTEESRVRSIQFDWQDARKTADGLGLSGDYLVLLPSSLDEVIRFHRERGFRSAFKDQQDFIETACASVAAGQQHTLVVRAHPNSGSSRSLGTNQSECDFYADLAQRYADSPHVRIVQPDEAVNTLSLCLGAALVLTWATSMTLELPCYGVCVAQAGGADYFQLPFVGQVPDRDLTTQITRLLAAPLSRTQIQLAVRYNYAWRFLAFMDVPHLHWPTWQAPRLLVKSSAELFQTHGEHSERLYRFILGESVARTPSMEPPQTFQSEAQLLEQLSRFRG